MCARIAGHAWFWGPVGAGIVLDLVTKAVAFRLWQGSVKVDLLSTGRRGLWGPAVIPGFLYMTPRRNPGMAFSAGSSIWWPLLAIVSAGIAGYVVWYRHKAVVGRGRRLFDLSMGLILAGAIGNLVDRILPPHMVRDFIDVWFGNWSYPVFNFADVFIVAGVIGYLWWGWRIEGRAEPNVPGEAGAGTSASPPG